MIDLSSIVERGKAFVGLAPKKTAPVHSAPLIISPDATLEEIAQPAAELTVDERKNLMAKEAIDRLGAKNIESIGKRFGRYGFYIGQGENEMFILAEPAQVDVEKVIRTDQGQVTVRDHKYIVFSRNGIRTVSFSKGSLMSDGQIEKIPHHMTEVFLDELLAEHSESNFIARMNDHAKQTENPDGSRMEEYPANLRYRDHYGLGNGFFQSEKGEAVQLMGQSWDSGNKGDDGPVTAEVDAAWVEDAMRRTKEKVQQPVSVVEAPAQVQTNILTSVLKDL